ECSIQAKNSIPAGCNNFEFCAIKKKSPTLANCNVYLCTIADLLYSLFISIIGGIGAGMAVPATCDELLDLVRKSGVADEKRLDALLREKRAAIPKDPKKVADFLIQNSILTNFQSENILLGKWKRFTI